MLLYDQGFRGYLANSDRVTLGKQITPRRRAVIIAFRTQDPPMPFKQIGEITGVAGSTANDIWRHAIKNARQARVTSDELEHNNQPLSLQELIASSALDPNPRPGRPRLLSEEDKDRLVEFVKKDFDSRRLTLHNLRREAGFSHISDSTVYRGLSEQGIYAYHEEFKIILKEENKKKRLVGCVHKSSDWLC